MSGNVKLHGMDARPQVRIENLLMASALLRANVRL